MYLQYVSSLQVRGPILARPKAGLRSYGFKLKPIFNKKIANLIGKESNRDPLLLEVRISEAVLLIL
jgi:hypothetical protein